MKNLLLLICAGLLSIGVFGADYYSVVASGNWNDANTWASSSGGAGGAGIPASTDNAFIETLVTIQAATVQECNNLTFSTAGELALNANSELKVKGNLINNSTQALTIILSGNAILQFDGAAAQTITTNTVLACFGSTGTITIDNANGVTLLGPANLETRGIVEPKTGVLSTNGYLVLKASTSTAYGRLKLNDENSSWAARVSYTGTITGNITVEKILETTLKPHLPAVNNAFNGTWFQMSMPVNTTAAGGAITGPSINFVDGNPNPVIDTRNVWWYNNNTVGAFAGYNKGWTRETSTIAYNKPYTIFLTDNTGGSPFATTQAISATGTVDLGSLPYLYDDNNFGYLADSAAHPGPVTADNSGWFFIANPMPAYIDTYNWLRTPSAGANASNQVRLQYPAVYVYNSIDDQYEGWTTSELQGGNPWPVILYNTAGGVNNSVDLDQKRIPPFQGFWMKGSSIPFLNEVDIERRTFTSDPGLGNNYQKTTSSAILQETAVLFAFDADSAKDITLVYYDDSKSTLFDERGDAYKLFSFSNNVPSLWFTESGSKVMSAGRPNKPVDTVDVHYFSYKNNSTAHLWLNDTNLSGSMDVMLYDKLTQQTQDMRANPSYQFTHNINNQNDRFLLIITNNAFGVGEFIPEEKAMTVYTTADQMVIESTTYTGPAVLTMYDMAGRAVLARKIEVTAGVTNFVQMPGLASSIYSVEINYGGKVMVEKIMK